MASTRPAETPAGRPAAGADSDGVRRCQVSGCDADLVAEGPYCLKRRCCSKHIRADAVVKEGSARNELHRFCFQCGKLEPLANFDEGKRSCRVRLQQRVKQTPKRRTTWTSTYNFGNKKSAQSSKSAPMTSAASADAASIAAAAATTDHAAAHVSMSRSNSSQLAAIVTQLPQQQHLSDWTINEQQEQVLAEVAAAQDMQQLQELQMFAGSFNPEGVAAAATPAVAAPAAAAAAAATTLCTSNASSQERVDGEAPAGTAADLPQGRPAAAAVDDDMAWDAMLLQLCAVSSDESSVQTPASDDATQLMAMLDRELSNAAVLARQTSMCGPSNSQNTSVGSIANAQPVPAFNLVADSSTSPHTMVQQQQQQLQLLWQQQQQQQQQQQVRHAQLLQQQQQLQAASMAGSLARHNCLPSFPGMSGCAAVGATPCSQLLAPLMLQQQQQQQQQQLSLAQLMQQYQGLMQQQQQLRLLTSPATACASLQQPTLGSAAVAAEQHKLQELEAKCMHAQQLLSKVQLLMSGMTASGLQMATF